MTRNARDSLFTPEQVADLLGLHVRTVRRYIREGQLPAVQVGKRYRVSRDALEAFAGVALEQPPAAAAPHTEVSTIVGVDGVSREYADRLTTLLVASAQGRSSRDEPLKVETLHYPERQRLKVVVSGDLAASMAVLALLDSLLEQPA